MVACSYASGPSVRSHMTAGLDEALSVGRDMNPAEAVKFLSIRRVTDRANHVFSLSHALPAMQLERPLALLPARISKGLASLSTGMVTRIRQSDRPPRRRKAAHAARRGDIRYWPSKERSRAAGMAGRDRGAHTCRRSRRPHHVCSDRRNEGSKPTRRARIRSVTQGKIGASANSRAIDEAGGRRGRSMSQGCALRSFNSKWLSCGFDTLPSFLSCERNLNLCASRPKA